MSLRCGSHTCEEQVPLGGLLPLLQARVQQAQQLQHSLLPARLREAGIVHDQVWINLAIVPSDVQPAGCCVVLLHNLHSGHKATEATERKV